MAEPRAAWINYLAGAAGGIVLIVGIIGLRFGFSAWDSFLAVSGFLLAGWAILDYRRFRRGTPESEVDGGHTVE